MKKMFAVAVALFCMLPLALKAEEAKPNDKPLTEVKKEIDDGKAVLVDVREQDEWNAKHLKGAQLLPLSSLKNEQAAANALPKDKTIYLHCKSGKRSAAAAEILNQRGFHAISLNEGVDELSKNGFELAK